MIRKINERKKQQKFILLRFLYLLWSALKKHITQSRKIRIKWIQIISSDVLNPTPSCQYIKQGEFLDWIQMD